MPLHATHTCSLSPSLPAADFEYGNIPEIVELAAATADGQTFPAEGSSSLSRPLGSIDEAASKTHGMRNSDLTEQPCAPVVLLQWLEWLTEQCQSAHGGSCRLVLAGHNIKA